MGMACDLRRDAQRATARRRGRSLQALVLDVSHLADILERWGHDAQWADGAHHGLAGKARERVFHDGLNRPRRVPLELPAVEIRPDVGEHGAVARLCDWGQRTGD